MKTTSTSVLVAVTLAVSLAGQGTRTVDAAEMDDVFVSGCTDVDLHPNPVAVIEPCRNVLRVRDLDRATFAAATRHLGDAFFRTRQYDKALEAYNKALLAWPDYPRALWNRANIYLVYGMYRDAVGDLERALKVDPGYARALESLGAVLSDYGRKREAIIYYDKALKADPSLLRVFLRRSRVHMRMREYGRALSDLNHILELSHKQVSKHHIGGQDRGLDIYGMALALRAGLHERNKNRDAARVDLDKLVALFPNLTISYLKRGDFNLEVGQPRDALADFSKAIELEPSNTDGLRRRAKAHKELRNYDLALDDLNLALKITPKYSWGYLTRAELHNTLLKTELALADYERAFELNINLLVNHQRYLRGHGYYSGETVRTMNAAIRNGTIACIVDPRC